MCMFFKCAIHKKCDNPCIFLSANTLEFVQETQYLGVFLSAAMKPSIDVKRQTRKLYVQANMLLRGISYCTVHTIYTRCQMYVI